MQIVRAAIGHVDLAVNDVRVCSRRGAMERPLKFAEAHGQPAEGDIALGARIAQALGFCFEMSSELGEQVGLVEIESFAQLQAQSAVFDAGQAEEEDLGWLAAEVGDELEAGLGRSRFDGSEVCFRGHEGSGNLLLKMAS